MTVYENNRPQPDIQSVFKEYLQLSNGLLDDFKNDDALIEISLTKTESQDLKIISLIGLLSKPIPISRIKKIYLSSALAKTDVLSTAQSTDAGVIPYFLINGYITVKLNQFNEIKGLQCIENFITDKEHNEIMNAINNSGWLSDLKRRVQHYGYKYDYKKRSLDYSMYLGDLPEWAKPIALKIVAEGYMKNLPDQLIVNEYKPGQGIADHIDCEPCFDDTIISLSLCSSCIMEFKNKTNRNQKHEILLQPKSLVVITGESRYNWTHGIPAREKDKWQDKIVYRKTRVSLTFRKVILADTQGQAHFQSCKT